MVPDIVDPFIVVWVSGLINLSFSFNVDGYGPVEADIGVYWGVLILFCE